jgi:hypothetical protein
MLSPTIREPVQPASIQDRLQVGEVGVLVVVEEDEVRA